jgi:hypothetical protein
MPRAPAWSCITELSDDHAHQLMAINRCDAITSPVAVSPAWESQQPLRELLPLRPAGWCLAYPYWSSISPSKSPLTAILVSRPDRLASSFRRGLPGKLAPRPHTRH